MNQILAKDELGDLHLFTQHPGFDVKTLSNGLTRKQFGIPEDVFLFVVVGLRLSQDVDDRFLQLLGNICEHPNAHVAFAGNFDNYDETVGQYPALRGRTTYLGFQLDIMGVYHIVIRLIPSKEIAVVGDDCCVIGDYQCQRWCDRPRVSREYGARIHWRS